MRNVSSNIPATVLRRVAKSVVETYPNSLQDRKNGKVYGNGFTRFYDSLKNRNNYLNRMNKNGPIKRMKTPASKVRFLQQAKLGAMNWQPENHPTEETDITIEDKRIALVNIRISQQETLNQAEVHEEIITLLTSTFKSIREFFNDWETPPTTATLYELCPIIYTKEYLCHLYYLQMGHSVQRLEQNFNSDRLHIFAYGRARNLTAASDVNDDYEIVKIIFKHLKEDVETLIKQCPADKTWVDLNLPRTGPFIVIHDLGDNNAVFHLIFNETHLDCATTFMEAFLWA